MAVIDTTPVDPIKVINLLKAKLAEECGRSAMLEAMLEESRERENVLARAMEDRRQQAAEEDGPAKTLASSAATALAPRGR